MAVGDDLCAQANSLEEDSGLRNYSGGTLGSQSRDFTLLLLLFLKDVKDSHNVAFSELSFGSLDSDNMATSGLPECLQGN